MSTYLSDHERSFRAWSWALIIAFFFILGAVLGPPLGEKILIGLFYLVHAP